MPTPTTGPTSDGHNDESGFVYAVSLLAALEGATGLPGHSEALPYLGMARAELVEYGQHQPAYFVAVEVTNFRASLGELEERLNALLGASRSLQQSLRIEAARQHLRRGIDATD